MYRPTFVYVLVGPDGRRGYTGVTTDLARRVKWHAKDARDGGTTHKCNWLRSIDYQFVVEVDSVWLRQKDAFQRERDLVARTRAESTNLTNGGEGFTSEQGALMGTIYGPAGGHATQERYRGTPEQSEWSRRGGGDRKLSGSKGGTANAAKNAGTPEQRAIARRAAKVQGDRNAERWAADPNANPMRNPDVLARMRATRARERRCLAPGCTFVGNASAVTWHQKRESHSGWELVQLHTRVDTSGARLLE